MSMLITGFCAAPRRAKLKMDKPVSDQYTILVTPSHRLVHMHAREVSGRSFVSRNNEVKIGELEDGFRKP